MKRGKLILVMLALVLAVSACGGKTIDVPVDYGKSELYTQAEMDEAISMIQKEFAGWEGCELHSVAYAGDECMTEENIAWMNSLQDGRNYTQCIEFISSFRSPKEGGGAWEPDTEYENYQWWLAREDGGSWELLTWGY